MRKLLGVFVLVFVAAALVPGTALAGPAKDSLVGTVKVPVPTPFGTFPAQISNNGESSSPTGIPATGHFTTDIYTGHFLGLPDPVSLSGDIICLTVVNNNAWVRSIITSSNTGLAPPGFTLLGRSIDNDTANGTNEQDNQTVGAEPPDRATGFLTPPGSTTCPTLPFATNAVTSGNLITTDGV